MMKHWTIGMALAMALGAALPAAAGAQEARWVIAAGSDSTSIVRSVTGTVRPYRVCGPQGQATRVRAAAPAPAGKSKELGAEIVDLRDLPAGSCIDIEGATIEVARVPNEPGILTGSYWRLR